MFEAKVKYEVLKEVVSVLSTLVSEAKFNINKKGLNIKAVDPSHVAMVDLNVTAKAFEHYKADSCELGVDLEKITDLLKSVKGGELIEMKHDEAKNRLVMTVGNLTRRMALVDTAGMSDPKVPSLELPAKVTIKTSELTRGIKASESVSDHISLQCNTDGFEMVSQGDTDNVNLKLPKDLLESLECKESTRSLFPLDYLSKMIKSVESSEVLTMYLGTDYPVKIEFDIASTAGNVKYLLAPRIESE